MSEPNTATECRSNNGRHSWVLGAHKLILIFVRFVCSAVIVVNKNEVALIAVRLIINSSVSDPIGLLISK